jgi:hypothetical protein
LLNCTSIWRKLFLLRLLLEQVSTYNFSSVVWHDRPMLLKSSVSRFRNRHLVGRLWRGIGPSQGLSIHPCFHWGSNSRSQCSSRSRGRRCTHLRPPDHCWMYLKTVVRIWLITDVMM